MRWINDKFTATGPGGASRQTLGDLREEVFVMTHSYVYHPNFLTLDIGAGPVLQQGRFNGDTGAASSRTTQYNFSSRATFLRDKPYRGSVFYEHLNPTLSVAPGSIMTQENTRYGFDASLLGPVPFGVDASRSILKGSSLDRTVNDQIDILNFRASRELGAGGLTQYQLQSQQQDSQSGSPSLPIQRTVTERQNHQLDTRVRFGAARQYEVYNLIALDRQSFSLTQGDLPGRDDRRILLDFRGQHSPAVSSFATYNHGATDQGSLHSRLNAGSGGLVYTPTRELSLRAGAHFNDNSATLVSSRTRGVEGGAQYRRPLAVGVLTAGLSGRFDRHDQRSSAGDAAVIGERIALAGTSIVALSQERIVLASIAVGDLARTQRFVEGADFLVSVVGNQTRVQRLAGGSILDGQEVVVDYSYDPGGTFAYDQADRTLTLDWDFRNQVGLYFRRLDSSPRLTSGTPSTPLNTVRSNLYGARAEIPFVTLPLEPALGGSYEREDRHETISPYERSQRELYVQTIDPLFDRGHLRFSVRQLDQDFESSPQGVRLSGSELRWWTRHPAGIDLTANLTFERDTGAPILRTRSYATGKALWLYRRLTMSMELTRLRETQGEFQRTRTLLQFLARRDF